MRRDGEVARHRRRPYTLTITAAVGSPCPLVTRMTAANTTVSKIPRTGISPCRGRRRRPGERAGATLFSLLSDLHLMDYESQHLLRHISERDRTLANYLKVMNKRIDLLGQVMVQRPAQGDRRTAQGQPVRGGVSFRHDRALPVGQLLVLRMVLLPQGFGLELRARVIHAQPRRRIRDRHRVRSVERRTAPVAGPAYPPEAGPAAPPGTGRTRPARRSRANLLRPEMCRCSVRYCCAPPPRPAAVRRHPEHSAGRPGRYPGRPARARRKPRSRAATLRPGRRGTSRGRPAAHRALGLPRLLGIFRKRPGARQRSPSSAAESAQPSNKEPQ